MAYFSLRLALRLADLKGLRGAALLVGLISAEDSIHVSFFCLSNWFIPFCCSSYRLPYLDEYACTFMIARRSTLS